MRVKRFTNTPQSSSTKPHCSRNWAVYQEWPSPLLRLLCEAGRTFSFVEPQGGIRQFRHLRRDGAPLDREFTSMFVGQATELKDHPKTCQRQSVSFFGPRWNAVPIQHPYFTSMFVPILQIHPCKHIGIVCNQQQFAWENVAPRVFFKMLLKLFSGTCWFKWSAFQTKYQWDYLFVWRSISWRN